MATEGDIAVRAAAEPLADSTFDGHVPRLLPVRMLNEFVYCPRLFHIEWVEQLFADNEFTVDGRWQHRAVDEASGATPSSDDDEPWKRATSVDLSSQRLGLIARADLIVADGDAVIPIDVKRGRPASTPERVWPPEQVQLCATGLLLRETGRHCEHGEVFFVGDDPRARPRTVY